MSRKIRKTFVLTFWKKGSRRRALPHVIKWLRWRDDYGAEVLKADNTQREGKTIMNLGQDERAGRVLGLLCQQG